MKNVKNLLLLCFISLISTSGYAATVNGTLTVGGVYVYDDSDAFNTTIALTDAGANGGALGDVVGTVSGDPAVNQSGVANLDNFSAVDSFFVVEGWTFDLKSLVVDDPVGFLNLSGLGVLTGNGFAATQATWTLSAEVDNSYSMEVTALGMSAVPVPAAVWLFGTGLIGLIGMARRKA